MDTSTPVVVGYRGGIGALAVARTLGRLGVRVYFLGDKASPGASLVTRSGYWTDRFFWNFDAPPDETLAFFLRVGDRIGSRPILVTLADWVAIFIENNADALGERFLFPRGSRGVVQTFANKWGMFKLAQAHGIPTPQTLLPSTRDDVLAFIQSASFPVVVKPADPSVPRTPEKAIVPSGRELLEKFDRDTELGPPNVVFQEYIPGTAEDQWICNAYFGEGSECRAIFTGKKLRQVNDTGIACLGICEPNETIERQTRQLMEGAGYQGAVDIGYRYDARDGLYKVLDVNARLGGAFRLFRATNGMDVTRICYCDLTGQPIPNCELQPGRKWLIEDDVWSSLTYARQGRLTFGSWLRSVWGVRETHWFAADDPLPGFAWLWKTLAPRVTRKWHREERAAQQRAGPQQEKPIGSDSGPAHEMSRR